MKRRDFLTATAAIGATTVTAGSSTAIARPDNTPNGREFKLKYAPHFNMFKNSAGDDPIDQLKFAADQGFLERSHAVMRGQRTPQHTQRDCRSRCLAEAHTEI